MFEEKITDDVHVLLKPYIKAGMMACDLTVGNGYDTFFLAEAVGEHGQVVGFDIQETALKHTEMLVDQYGYKHVDLYLKCHSELDSVIQQPFHIGMMNLGYLPGSDKHLVTKAETTIKAISKFLEMVESDGVLSIVAYKGHDHSVEYEAVEKYLSALSPRKFKVRNISYVNRKNNVPVIFFIHKK